MNLLSDVITYVRRIIKSPSDAVITDNLIIDYIDRFWLMDVDARMQLFDLKTVYRFQTTPGIDQYNMPLYTLQTQPGGQQIAPYPVYQGFMGPARANGFTFPLFTQRSEFFSVWPNLIQAAVQVALGDGTSTYSFTLPFFPALPGHVDMTGIIATWPSNTSDPIIGSTFNTAVPVTSVSPGVFLSATDSNGQNILVSDSGQFLSGNTGGDLYGLLMAPGQPPLGNASLGLYTTTSNTVNYKTGVVNVTFPAAVPAGTPIQAQCYIFTQGLPRAALFYNNVITLRSPPNTQYLIELDAYLTPAAFLSTGAALPFAYMAEYIARGAARKILSDTGDVEQFEFYEQFFKEQEMLVWKRSQRQFTATRTNTIYSFPNWNGGFNQTITGL